MTCIASHGWSKVLQNISHLELMLCQELLRNVKREFGKLLNLLQAYAIISYGVRIVCTNQVGATA